MSTKRELKRDTQRGKVAGVCAGLAHYLNIEVWLVLVVFFTGLVFSGSFFLVLYVAGWLILDKRSEFELSDEHAPISVKTNVWRAGETPRKACHDIDQEFADLETKLQRMERYVTSNEFQLNREISRL